MAATPERRTAYPSGMRRGVLLQVKRAGAVLVVSAGAAHALRSPLVCERTSEPVLSAGCVGGETPRAQHDPSTYRDEDASGR